MAGSSIKKFLVTKSYAPESLAIDWSILPDSFLDHISRRLYNISAVSENGDIIERTVIFIRPVDFFTDDTSTVELFNGKVMIGKNNKEDEEL